MKRFLFFAVVVLSFFQVSAQDLVGYQKLRGTILATAPDDDYTLHAYNAFDTNEGTSFMAREVGGWVALDLGSDYSIRKIRVYPMPERNRQFVGAKFQGADNPEFTNPVTLFTVTEAPNIGEYATYDIPDNNKYRYVRCINPDHRCSISELEFYTDENAQPVSYPKLTNIPTIYLETQGSFDFVSKGTYVKAKVAVAGESGAEVYDAEVRGRGNSTWEFMEKKPFRIKFDKKQHFLGLPANAKSWTLIALAVDKTLLRNGLAFEISKSLGFEFTPSCVLVDVVLDGFYYGTYMASDHIEINENRINVDEMKASDTELPNLSGGYHLEIDAYADQEPVYFVTPRGIPFTIKSPENDVTSQYKWIEDHIARTENMLFENTEEALEKYIDIESAVKYYIHSELTGNCDAYWCIPCYKKRDDDKLYFGPVWDYDQAFLTNYRVPLYTETLSTQHGVAQLWFRKIMQSPSAQQVLNRLWKKAKEDNLKQHLLSFLDDKSTGLQQSQALNFQRWNSLSRKVWFEDALFGTYGEYIDFVKSFIEERFTWFDELVKERKAILPVSTPGNPLQSWNYTVETPAPNWYAFDFDSSSWQSGNAPFGNERGLQNTSWTTDHIYLRTKFFVDIDDINLLNQAFFYLFHDEDCRIYLNGELAFERRGYITDYQYFEFDKKLLKTRWNTLAVECTQSSGGQLIDVGVYGTYDDPISSVPNESLSERYSWFVRNGLVHINQISENEIVKLYSIDGKLLEQQKAPAGNEVKIQLPKHGIYFVRLQGGNIKIVY